MTLGLELGGKDPAYVLPDVNLDHAVANLVDGAFSIPASAAAGSSASMFMKQSMTASSMVSST